MDRGKRKEKRMDRGKIKKNGQRKNKKEWTEEKEKKNHRIHGKKKNRENRKVIWKVKKIFKNLEEQEFLVNSALLSQKNRCFLNELFWENFAN